MPEDSQPVGRFAWGGAAIVIALMVVCGAGYIILHRDDIVHDQAAFFCRGAAWIAAAGLGMVLGFIALLQREKKLLPILAILMILLSLLSACAVFAFVLFILWGMAVH